MQKSIIEIQNAIPRLENIQFKKPIYWQINENEHWAIIGRNGSGKTLLTDILTGKYALKSGEIICNDENNKPQMISSVVKSVAFRDIYSIIDTQNSYYQQRWNKGDEHEVPLVKDLITKADQNWLNSLIEWFGIEDLLNKEVNMLSSGELRKFLIIRSLLSRPRILILDNPFIGLDAASRDTLNNLLKQLSELEKLQIILVLSNPDDIPDLVTKILPIQNKEILPPILYSEYKEKPSVINDLFQDNMIENFDHLKLNKKNTPSFDKAAILKNIHIKYGQRTILKNLNWEIVKGEKWTLLGANGSGKSTLLSLICGDNPQAYANDITLFDRKRGSGESIWDIKERIGYISPEMHLYYLKNVKCLDVVGSGFFDTIGLYRKCNKDQESIALEWMKLFRVDHLKDISFLQISSGEQRLILLARVFVKNPDLLILDEPLHGLDIVNKKRVKKIIEDFCDTNKSLIYVTHYENEIPSVVDKRLTLIKNIS
ncbi:MAG: ATP-binding cassette domain-containing protein [Dysgonomonas sp.]|nr:ATP-binding cassette domain-containing protein [Dysgonomonas sp.]